MGKIIMETENMNKLVDYLKREIDVLSKWDNDIGEFITKREFKRFIQNIVDILERDVYA